MIEGPISEALTFDDVLLLPGKSSILPTQADTRTCLSRKISLNIPIVAAAMDTVTDARLAIAIARQGGIGFIHRNMTIDRQAEEVDRVKRSESGMIVDPVTIAPELSVRQARQFAEPEDNNAGRQAKDRHAHDVTGSLPRHDGHDEHHRGHGGDGAVVGARGTGCGGFGGGPVPPTGVGGTRVAFGGALVQTTG